MAKTPEEKAAEAAAKAEAKAKADADKAAAEAEAKAKADAEAAAKAEASAAKKDPRQEAWDAFLARAEAQAKENGTFHIFEAQKANGEFDKIPAGFETDLMSA